MTITMNQIKKKVLSLLEKSILKLTENRSKKYGLLLSGGIDSSILAIILKNNKIKFNCFFAYVKDTTDPKDLYFAKKLAKDLDLNLEIISCEKKELPIIIKDIIKITKSSNPITVGVAIPGYLCAKKAKSKKINVLFSGLGSDELFAGYHKFRLTKDIKEETKKCLDNLQKDNLDRDQAIASYFNLSVECPYLDKDLINYSLNIDPKYLISKTQNKIIIREIGKDLGLNKEFSERKKVACQYGSNSDRVIEKLAKENKFKTKTDYLNSLYKKNIGALFSGGKDSNLSMFLLKDKYNISCLLSIIPTSNDSYMYQKPDLKILKSQADCLNLPLLTQKSKSVKEDELNDLEELIKTAIKKYNITGIVCGALFSNYQKERVLKICNKLKIELHSPLWQMDQEKEIELLLNNKFKFIVCKIAALGLDQKYLGKVISKEDLTDFKKLNKKYGFNIAGEGGEYETIVIDSPMFNKKIEILDYKIIMENDFTGFIEIKKIKNH